MEFDSYEQFATFAIEQARSFYANEDWSPREINTEASEYHQLLADIGLEISRLEGALANVSSSELEETAYVDSEYHGEYGDSDTPFDCEAIYRDEMSALRRERAYETMPGAVGGMDLDGFSEKPIEYRIESLRRAEAAILRRLSNEGWVEQVEYLRTQRLRAIDQFEDALHVGDVDAHARTALLSAVGWKNYTLRNPFTGAGVGTRSVSISEISPMLRQYLGAPAFLVLEALRHIGRIRRGDMSQHPLLAPFTKHLTRVITHLENLGVIGQNERGYAVVPPDELPWLSILNAQREIVKSVMAARLRENIVHGTSVGIGDEPDFSEWNPPSEDYEDRLLIGISYSLFNSSCASLLDEMLITMRSNDWQFVELRNRVLANAGVRARTERSREIMRQLSDIGIVEFTESSGEVLAMEWHDFTSRGRQLTKLRARVVRGWQDRILDLPASSIPRTLMVALKETMPEAKAGDVCIAPDARIRDVIELPPNPSDEEIYENYWGEIEDSYAEEFELGAGLLAGEYKTSREEALRDQAQARGEEEWGENNNIPF